MNELLKINIPVTHESGDLGTIMLLVEKTCMAGMDVVVLTNKTSNALGYEIIGRDGVLDKDILTYGEARKVGLIPAQPIIFKAEINRFTRLELVIIKREGVVSALAKVYVRGALHLNAMYRGDDKHRIVVDKFTKVTQEMAAWRKPNSRLSSALKAVSK